MLNNALPLIPVLALAIVSFIASSYVIMSTLIPILPPHPLSGRLPRQAFGLAKRSLSPAQRATLYIAICDIIALAAFMWQAIAEVMRGSSAISPAISSAAAARLWIALTARQTCLLIVALLTLLYVRLGKTLTFGAKDFYVWAPSAVIIILSTAVSSGFTAIDIHTFFYGAIAYTTITAITATAAFGFLLYSLLNIRRHLAAIALARDDWPPMVQNRRGSFATEDIDALRDGSSWLTSTRSDRTQSVSAFSFATTQSSAAAPSSTNPYSNSIPAKSSFWFGASSTQNLNEGFASAEENVPPVPELPQAYRRTSSPMGAEPDPFRREAPASVRSSSVTNSWLTEPSGSVSTPTQFSFPTTRPSSPVSSLHPSTASHDSRTNTDARYGANLSTPITTTAFSPSPRASSEQRDRPSDEALIKAPRAVLGGYGPSGITDPEKALDSSAKVGAENLTPWRLIGWFISIWVPFVFALPYLALNSSTTSFNTTIPLILLTLSITLSSPILAIHVFCNSYPVPVIPAELFAPVSGRASLLGSVSSSSGFSGPALPYDMVAHSASQLTFVAGRRSGDIWIEKGYASDDGRSKFSRALSMVSPVPKLAVLDPMAPESSTQGSRTLTNPTPEPHAAAVAFPVGAQYDADPVIEAASKILAQQAADKAERARLESQGSSYSQVEESFQAKVMVAQRHYSTMALASTVHIPPSNPVSPALQTEFNADGAKVSSISMSRRTAGSAHLRTRSSSSVITARTLNVNNVNASVAPLTPPPAFPLPPTPESKFSPLRHGRSQSHGSSFYTPRSNHSSASTYEIDELSAQVLPMLLPNVRIGEDVRVRHQPSAAFAGPDFSPSSIATSQFRSFNAMDEDEVEDLVLAAAGGSSAGTMTPKSKMSKMMSIPEHPSFSSPENHSTPKKKKHSKRHLSLPSLNLRKGQPWREEITFALEELGILRTDDDSRRRTIHVESPPKPAGKRGSMSFARRKAPPPSLELPPIARRFSTGGRRALEIEVAEQPVVTPSATSDFIVQHPDGTPQVQAVPQPMTSNAPYVFHRPTISQPAAAPLPAPQFELEEQQQQPKKRSSIVYKTSNPASISVYRDPVASSSTNSLEQVLALPPHLRPTPRAWPPPAAALARAAGFGNNTTNTKGSSSSSELNSDPDYKAQQQRRRQSSTNSPLRPLSLLQGRNANTPKTSSGTTGTTLPLATPKRPSVPTPGSNTTAEKKRRSAAAGGVNDENRIVEGKGNDTGGRGSRKSIPGSGLKPLKLARSATSKARGVLRKEEVLPDVVIRPPSTSAHSGFAYSFRRAIS